MAILWMGGEDIDFPNGTGSVAVPQISGAFSTITAVFRPAFGRTGLRGFGTGSTGVGYSNSFPGGAVTSCWLSFQMGLDPAATGSSLGVGLCDTTNSGAGIFLGQASTQDRVSLKSRNAAGTVSLLMTGPFALYSAAANGGTLTKYDMQVINFGATATVNVYVNGSLYFSYTGSTVISGTTNLNAVGLVADGASWAASEFIVSTIDTRSMSLMTLALTGIGTTDNWTGAFSNVNPITVNDANVVVTNTVSQDEQFNVTDLAAGTFSVLCLKIAARPAVSTSPTATKVALGFNSGGTVAVATAHSPTTSFATVEDLFVNNPVTGVGWVQSDINALQINLRSS